MEMVTRPIMSHQLRPSLELFLSVLISECCSQGVKLVQILYFSKYHRGSGQCLQGRRNELPQNTRGYPYQKPAAHTLIPPYDVRTFQMCLVTWAPTPTKPTHTQWGQLWCALCLKELGGSWWGGFVSVWSNWLCPDSWEKITERAPSPFELSRDCERVTQRHWGRGFHCRLSCARNSPPLHSLD